MKELVEMIVCALVDRPEAVEISEIKGTHAHVIELQVAKEDLATNAQNWISKGEENLLRNIPEVWGNAVSLLDSAGMIDTRPDPTSLYTNMPLERALG